MDKESAWVIPAAVGGVLLINTLFSLGGFAGIARAPAASAIVLAVVLVGGVPSLWFTYRRDRRDPIIAPVETTLVDVFGPPLDGAPVEFVGSTWKVLARAAYVAAACSVFAGFFLEQPGVCRAAGVSFVVPLALWSVVTLLACAIKPERLTIAREGLTHVWLWSTRHWGWDEVRDIRMVKQRIPIIGRFMKRSPVASIYFKPYRPPGQTGGRARVAFRSMYKADGYEIAGALDSARAEWSTPAGAFFTPVPQTWRSYLSAGVWLAIVGALTWIAIAHPCGH